jgi:hypothetical protein
VLAPAAAGSVLELDGAVHCLGRLCFFILWEVFVFAVAFVGSLLVMPPSAAYWPPQP